MTPWFIDPPWQNFSSLVREAATALEAKTGMEKSHHKTAALYFGIAALEAFINAKMRNHLKAASTEEEIYNVLRNEKKLLRKLKRWPRELIGEDPAISDRCFELITLFNDVRSDLTHPKTQGHDIYERLETVSPEAVVDAVAEYIVRFHEAQHTLFPYWIFGWNYLNPRQNEYDIMIIGDPQFCFSLQALGFQVPAASYVDSTNWRDRYLGTFDGYLAVKQALASIQHCEKESGFFPYKPILCRRWWTPEHQRTCGHVTKEAVDLAR